MENPYEGPALGGQEENTENRVKTYYTVKLLIIISCRTVSIKTINLSIADKDDNDVKVNVIVAVSK